MDHKESWALKNQCFWTVVLEKTLERVLWTARRSNQSIQKEINPEYLLEGLILKLKLQYLGHLMQRAIARKRPKCWEGLKARGERGSTGQDAWMASPTQWTWIWANSKRQCSPEVDRGALKTAVHGVAKSGTQLSNWTATEKWKSSSLKHRNPGWVSRLLFWGFRFKTATSTLPWISSLLAHSTDFRSPDRWIDK